MACNQGGQCNGQQDRVPFSETGRPSHINIMNKTVDESFIDVSFILVDSDSHYDNTVANDFQAQRRFGKLWMTMLQFGQRIAVGGKMKILAKDPAPAGRRVHWPRNFTYGAALKRQH
jgi:hypothetical protein